MRPSLTELAALHAERRLTKKERNAELRVHGYNPDGDDGRLYRRAYATALQSGDMAAYAVDLAAACDPDCICLWEFPAEDWPEAVARGLTDMPLAAYTERLAVIERELIAAGRNVIRVAVTVAEMQAVLKEHNWPNDTQHRAAALRFVHEAQK